MVRQRMVPLAVMVLALASTSLAQTKPSLDDLGWLSGCWEGRVRDAVIEEIWSKPGGMSMLGLGRTVKENRTVSFRIHADSGGEWKFCFSTSTPGWHARSFSA
ncbi:MAG: DUF6265 family protein [Acidobacteriota bacterium]|nr:DUF6265 family protein [Acidobacteriota bacterium]